MIPLFAGVKECGLPAPGPEIATAEPESGVAFSEKLLLSTTLM